MSERGARAATDSDQTEDICLAVALMRGGYIIPSPNTTIGVTSFHRRDTNGSILHDGSIM